MSEIKKPYNSYQEMSYKLAYSTAPKKRERISHWKLTYNGQDLTGGLIYSACQIAFNQFKMEGLRFPDKTKFKIVPYR